MEPKLRFPGFSGEWVEKMLGEVANVTTGNKDTQNKVDNGKYPFFVRSNTVERINSYSYDGEAILTSGDGVGVGKNFHYINGKFDFHQRVYCLNKFKEDIFGKFLYLIFLDRFYKRVIRLSAKNSVDSVRKSMIVDMKLHLPSLPEQQKIADFLTTVDDKIQSLTQKKEALTQYKKGLLQKLFPKAGETVPELRFSGFEGAWVEKRLGEVAKINPKNDELPTSFNYVDLESVNNGILKNTEVICKENAPSRAQRILKTGDILYQTVRPYQKNNLFFNIEEGDFVASTGYALLRTKNISMYLYQLLHTQGFVNKVILRCTGTSYPAINSSDLSKIKVLLPNLPEQQKIADFLTTIDKKITQVDQQSEEITEFKKGLLQQMFV